MFKPCFSLLPMLLASGSALALSCASENDTGCISLTQSAEDCSDLGYSLVEKNIDGYGNDTNGCHYLSCPFNTDYKVCINESCGKCDDPEPEPNTCPDGKIDIKYCTGPNNLAVEQEQNCVRCDYCSTASWVKAGDSRSENCRYVSAQGITWACCKSSCENTCIGGTLITSEDQITDPGTYCLGANITLSRQLSGSYLFKPATSNSGMLTIDATTFAYQEIISYVTTTVKSGARVENLKLHAGGVFKAPLNCIDPSSLSGETCDIELFGPHSYDFSESANSGSVKSPVTCTNDGGSPSIIISGSTGGYRFSGSETYSSSDGTKTITVKGNCGGHVCTKGTKTGKITASSNDCQ